MTFQWIIATAFLTALSLSSNPTNEGPPPAEAEQKAETALDKFYEAKSGGKKYSKCQSAAISNAFNTASNEEKTCMMQDIDDQGQDLLKLCEELGAGRNIGGGCYHLIGYLHDNQIEKALNTCGVSWSYGASCNENGGTQ